MSSILIIFQQMKNVSISVGHYERQSFPWDKLVEDFVHHAKYQLVQQVKWYNITCCTLHVQDECN